MLVLLFEFPTGELLPTTAVLGGRKPVITDDYCLFLSIKNKVLERHTSMAKKETSASALKN
jgi:hypothetical protein